MSRVGSATRLAATVGARHLRRRSGPLLYLSIAMTSVRIVRRFVGRTSERLLLTDIDPGEGLSIRVLRRGE